MSAGCIFCQIATGVIQTPLVYEDEDVVGFRDIHPQAPTHLLVIPRRHFSDVVSLVNEGDERLVGHLLTVAARTAEREGLVGLGFRLVTNTGAYGGQSVPHVHVHILGGRQFAWPPG